MTSEEYKLLHRLNQVTIAKYQDMTALAGRLNEVSKGLNDKCKMISLSLSLSLSSIAYPSFSLSSCISTAILWSDRPGRDECQCSWADGLPAGCILQKTGSQVQRNGEEIVICSYCVCTHRHAGWMWRLIVSLCEIISIKHMVCQYVCMHNIMYLKTCACMHTFIDIHV